MRCSSKFILVHSLYSLILFTLISGGSGCSLPLEEDLPLLEAARTESSCQASSCHQSAPLQESAPTSGRHTSHLSDPQLSRTNSVCNNCHWDYNFNPLHRNGFINGYDAQSMTKRWGGIVLFGGLLENGQPVGGVFDNATGQCSQVTCHGEVENITLDWYSGFSGCLGCHSILLDNGDGRPAGGRRAIATEFPSNNKHAHYGSTLTDSSCTVCHDQSTHMDGYIDLFAQDNEYTGAVNGSGVRVYRFVQATDLPDNCPASGTDCDLSDFCLGCHDSNGATRLGAGALNPFGNGNVPPDTRSRLAGTLSMDDPKTGRKVNSHHDISYNDQSASASKVECRNCHGSHTVARNRPISDPFDNTSPWNYNPAASSPRDINTFCLSCHEGNTPGNPDFPPTVYAAEIIQANNEVIIDFGDLAWQDSADGGGYVMSGSCAGQFVVFMNDGEWVDNSLNCITPAPDYPGYKAAYPDAACYSDPAYAIGYITGNLVPYPTYCNFPGPLDNTLRINVFQGTFQTGDYIVFKYCDWWGGDCDYQSNFYTNGWSQINTGAGAITVIESGDIGASLLRGIDSSFYPAEPWKVFHSWTDAYHGLTSRRDGNEGRADPWFAAELRCTDCHEYHGSIVNGSGNPYMLRDAVDGTRYFDDGSLGYRQAPTPGTLVDPLVINPNDPTTGGVDYKPLCNACHNYDYVGTGGHSDPSIPCITCHQHGGTFGGN